MAMPFPLSQAAFFDGLPVADSAFFLPAFVNISRTRGGAIRTATLGERLWTGRLSIPVRRHADAAAIEAKLSVLSEAGRSFFAHPLPITGPIADPTGAGLVGFSPVIYALQEGGREMRVSGLPAGYVLTAGDMIGWTYGSNPTRYAVHRLVRGAIASGAGITPLFEVTPAIRPGAVTGAAVALVKPPLKAVLIPGQPALARLDVTSGLTLEFIQTLS